MSGGGGRVSKGRMGSSLQVEVDPDELEDMQQRLEQVLFSHCKLLSNDHAVKPSLL